MAGDEEIPSVKDQASAMNASIQFHLNAMEMTLRAEMVRCSDLIEDAPFANGLSKAAATWKRDLEVIADRIRDEAGAVERALLGKVAYPITQSANHELSTTAASDPDRKRV